MRSQPKRSVLLSIGYEGRDLTDFGAALQAHRISTLVDVRLTPLSRKPGFSKSRLAAYLDTIGIDYQHAPLLGNPRDNRPAFADPSTIGEGRRRFRERLRSKSRFAALHEVVTLAERGRVALLCVERHADQCHRKVLLDAALRISPSLRVEAIT
jgi:uncharacterized protein (DUF488 family)